MAISSWQQTRERWTDSYQPMPDPTHLYNTMCSKWTVQSYIVHRYVCTCPLLIYVCGWKCRFLIDSWPSCCMLCIFATLKYTTYTFTSGLLLVNIYVLYAKEFWWIPCSNTCGNYVATVLIILTNRILQIMTQVCLDSFFDSNILMD